jgi:hypothetical protein
MAASRALLIPAISHPVSARGDFRSQRSESLPDPSPLALRLEFRPG